jgi:hypothetical protein
MLPIIQVHGSHSVHPVGLLYAHLYWLCQKDDQATALWPEVAQAGFTPGRHVASFPGERTATTFQPDPAKEAKVWHFGQDKGGVFANIDSRDAAVKAIAAIAAQGEGLVTAGGGGSHFNTYLEIYKATDFSELSLPHVPIDPFVADGPAPAPEREANRITNKLAAALCAVFDSRYQILLASLRAALARDRSDAGATELRVKYASWAFQEMLSPIKVLHGAISGLPCKSDGTVDQLRAAPTFNLGSMELPDDAAALDQVLQSLHRSAASAITAALAENPSAATKFNLQEMQRGDHLRFPNP